VRYAGDWYSYLLKSFGLIGIQLPEKYKENFNVLSTLRPFVGKLEWATNFPMKLTFALTFVLRGSHIFLSIIQVA
jgi:hypothetical protein